MKKIKQASSPVIGNSNKEKKIEDPIARKRLKCTKGSANKVLSTNSKSIVNSYSGSNNSHSFFIFKSTNINIINNLKYKEK